MNALRAALRGDCHTHTDWSDGGATLAEMVGAAAERGHDYVAITDHSPRLTIARGLTAERLRRQLTEIAEINAALADTGFRVLTGIEVDILADGSLDQDPGLLAELDIVVGSVHSGLRDDRATMTRRMVTALSNPHLDILGHCTGRKLRVKTDAAHAASRWRPPSVFDADAVFAAAVRHDKAIEINCRPDRRDPPSDLLKKAAGVTGLRFAIDTDAHAVDQLDWQQLGCERANAAGITADRVVNTLGADDLLAWCASHSS
ncbi:MAG: PHP domain-containing protein [Hamadaea sp.]|nr:PHP domain-containing protein [Hamadaea sp.]